MKKFEFRYTKTVMAQTLKEAISKADKMKTVFDSIVELDHEPTRHLEPLIGFTIDQESDYYD